jgi:glycosyltransferase A (GT-A) superfamily protein (DUF2064 family)
MTADSPTRTAIVVVAKAPIAGIAKTRLGREIGYGEAARLYAAFLLDTLQAIDAGLSAPETPFAGGSRWISCPDESHRSVLAQLVGPAWPIVPQRRRGLMGALADSFDDGFDAGADVVAVVDADSPGLPFSQIEACIQLVQSNRAVLGPTLDGGYYLIAVHRDLGRRAADLVLGRHYDGRTICDETIHQAESLGVSVAKGPLGFDVDTADDLEWLINNFPSNGMARTRHAVAALASSPARPGLVR